MPSKAKKVDRDVARLPSIPKELVELFLTGPMTGEAINDAGIAFKKALIEASLNAELSRADDALVDIASGGFDCGMRLMELMPEDMMAIPVGPEQQHYCRCRALISARNTGYFLLGRSACA
jgi:DNA-binding transcriptional LysR family regulator